LTALDLLARCDADLTHDPGHHGAQHAAAGAGAAPSLDCACQRLALVHDAAVPGLGTQSQRQIVVPTGRDDRKLSVLHEE